MCIRWGGQVVQETFLKQKMHNSIFHLVWYNNSTIAVYLLFFSRYTSVATNLTLVVLFEEGSPGIC